MTALRLPDAAKQVGLHRSSLFRAIKAGKLSATRTEGGDFLIDASELFRVYLKWTPGMGPVGSLETGPFPSW